MKRPVASLTKICTGVIATDWAIATKQDLKKVMAIVPDSVTRVGGVNPLNLQPGQQISLSDALYAALLGSDNLAAMTIADHIGRDINNRRGKNDDPIWAFVKEMHELCRVLGMKNTRFLNPHGLELPKQEGFSTAADMAKLSIYAMRRPAFAFFVRQKSRTISVAGRSYVINNTNQLVGEQGILGIDMGPAGHVVAADDGHEFFINEANGLLEEVGVLGIVGVQPHDEFLSCVDAEFAGNRDTGNPVERALVQLQRALVAKFVLNTPLHFIDRAVGIHIVVVEDLAQGFQRLVGDLLKSAVTVAGCLIRQIRSARLNHLADS
jgi:hypothetical protein